MGQIKAGRVDLNKQKTDGTELTLSQKLTLVLSARLGRNV